MSKQCTCSIYGTCFYCQNVGFTANSTVDDRERRKKLRCSLCPPNRKENAKRKPKHGVKKPKKP